MTDGRLTQTGEFTWQGWLAGYRVDVFCLPRDAEPAHDTWHAAILPGGTWTRISLRGTSLKDAAKKAREWVEANPVETV